MHVFSVCIRSMRRPCHVPDKPLLKGDSWCANMSLVPGICKRQEVTPTICDDSSSS